MDPDCQGKLYIREDILCRETIRITLNIWFFHLLFLHHVTFKIIFGLPLCWFQEIEAKSVAIDLRIQVNIGGPGASIL